MLYTIGYQGKNIDEFKHILKENKIDLLLDVRANGWSRKPNFSNKQLKEHVTSTGIEYAHNPVLGSPREIRNRLDETKDYEAFTRDYLTQLRTASVDMRTIAELMRSRRVCLMCYEANAAECHRSILAEEIKKVANEDSEVIHL